jgi:general secretion pathway protein I
MTEKADRCAASGSGAQAGFSLLEVLVALMILALAMTVAFRVFSGGLRNLALSGQYTRAAMLAESQLAGVGVDEPLEVGEEQGEWPDDYRWRRRVEIYRPWGGRDPEPTGVPAFVVTLEVAWDELGRERRVAFTTLRLLDSAEVGR